MIYAEKGNRVRQIQESEIQRYVEQGYQITDGAGTVLKETVPTDLATLRLAYTQHTEKIKELLAEIASLKAALESAKPKKTYEASETTADAPKPKRSRKADVAE